MEELNTSPPEEKVMGTPIFDEFVLEYPDFIEFDDLNGVIVTKHDVEKVCRVWCMRTIQLLHIIKHNDLAEFKIW